MKNATPSTAQRLFQSSIDAIFSRQYRQGLQDLKKAVQLGHTRAQAELNRVNQSGVFMSMHIPALKNLEEFEAEMKRPLKTDSTIKPLDSFEIAIEAIFLRDYDLGLTHLEDASRAGNRKAYKKLENLHTKKSFLVFQIPILARKVRLRGIVPPEHFEAYVNQSHPKKEDN